MALVFLQGHFQPNHHLNNRCWVITYVKRVPVTGVQLKSGSEWRQKALCLIKRRHFMFDIIQRTIEMYIFGDSQEGAITFYCCKCAFFKLLILLHSEEMRSYAHSVGVSPWWLKVATNLLCVKVCTRTCNMNTRNDRHFNKFTIAKFNWAVKLYNHHHQ